MITGVHLWRDVKCMNAITYQGAIAGVFSRHKRVCFERKITEIVAMKERNKDNMRVVGVL